MNELPFGELFKTAWIEWVQERKDRKYKKYTERGLKKTLTHLVTISGNDEQTAIKILDQSIIQVYQGLFPLKNNYGTNINSQSNGTHKPGTSEARVTALKEWGKGT